MIYDTIKAKLETDIDFRERRHRNKGLTEIMLQDYEKSDSMFIDKDFLYTFGPAYGTYERVWRKVLEENEDLRGFDYDDKTEYEQKKQIELGYEPGFNVKLNI